MIRLHVPAAAPQHPAWSAPPSALSQILSLDTTTGQSLVVKHNAMKDVPYEIMY